MKKTAVLITVFLFLGGNIYLQSRQQEQTKQETQEKKQTAPPEKKAEEKGKEALESDREEPLRIQRPPYDSGGRRDPFRNLLAGQEVKEKDEETGEPKLYISEVKLLGIIKSRGKPKVVIAGPEGFPVYISIGYKFADGYLHAVEGSKVIFHKTIEAGMTLQTPKEVVKEF